MRILVHEYYEKGISTLQEGCIKHTHERLAYAPLTGAPNFHVLEPCPHHVVAIFRVPRDQAILRVPVRARVIEGLHAASIILSDLKNSAPDQLTILRTLEHRYRNLVWGDPTVLCLKKSQLLRILQPQWCPDDPRSDCVHSYSMRAIQSSEASDKAGNGELGCSVERSVEVWRVSSHGRYVNNPLRIGRRDRGSSGWRVQPVRHCELCYTDRVAQVDVQEGVATRFPVYGVFALRRAWRVPEIGPVWLIHAGTGADDVDVPKL